MSKDLRSPTPQIRSTSRARLWLFRLIAMLLIPALFLLCVECVFRIVAPGFPTSIVIPNDSGNKLIDNYKFSWRYFPQALARSPQPISTEINKPTGRKRIVVFGGSAAMGDPESAYGFPRCLQVLLQQRYPDQDFEVINAAVTAINSHVVLPISHDCRRLDADAWAIYLGNNEVHGPYGAGTVFGGRETPLMLIRAGLALKRSSFGQFLASTLLPQNESIPKTWGGMEMFLDQKVPFDSPELDRVYENYRANLRSILATGVRAGSQVVIGTVASNLKDSPPFVSIHRADLSDEQQEEWNRHYGKGCEDQIAGRHADAHSSFQAAAAIDDHFAELHFRMGQLELANGNDESAKEQFTTARDYDALRFRADTKINEIIRQVANDSESSVRLVDCIPAFVAASSDGIPGRDFFYEHVHFTFEGNYLLATTFADELVDALQLGDETGGWASADECARELGFTAFHRIQIIKEMQSRLNSAPFTAQIGAEERIASLESQRVELQATMSASRADAAVEQYRDLIARNPNDWILKKQFSLLLDSRGDTDGTIEQWKAITEQLPHYAEGWSAYGTLLNRAKRREEAEIALRKTISLRPYFPTAHNSLGICLSHQGKFEESYEQFATAVQQLPSFAEAFLNWGKVLANQDQWEDAVERYKLALEADPNYYPAIEQLRQYYFDRRDMENAEPYYRRITELKPRETNAWVNHVALLLKMQRSGDAIAQLETALDLMPDNRELRQLLGRVKQAQGQ